MHGYSCMHTKSIWMNHLRRRMMWADSPAIPAPTFAFSMVTSTGISAFSKYLTMVVHPFMLARCNAVLPYRAEVIFQGLAMALHDGRVTQAKLMTNIHDQCISTHHN